jgi:glycosyltransferase involved in cell wall biosynthesis
MANTLHQKKVSVIIPTFNRAAFLKTAVQSVLKQNYDNFEIIIVDDNSQDNTQAVVKKFSDERIRYTRHQQNKGVSAARNTAIKASKGEYIAFLDDDDEWVSEKLKKQVEIIEKSSVKVCGVYSSFFIIENKKMEIGNISPHIKNKRGNLFEQFAFGNPIHTSTVLIRSECLEEVGLFDESISFMEDRDLWIRLSMRWNFEFIDQPLIKVYSHKQRKLSENLEGQIRGRQKILERYDYLFNKDRKTWSKLHLLQGAQYCQLKDMKTGRKNIVRGIKIYPFNFNAYLHLFSALLGNNAYQRLRKPFRSSI